MIFCDYGCGKEAKYILKNGKNCCNLNSNTCVKEREKRSNSVKKAHEIIKEKTGSALFTKNSKINNKEEYYIEKQEKCFYCGKEAKYVLKNKKGCCEKSPNKCIVNKYKNSNSISKAHKEGRMNASFGNKRQWWKEKNIKEVQEIRKRQGKTYSDRIKKGEIIPSFKGKYHTKETKQRMSKKAKERNNGLTKTKWFKIYSFYMNKIVSVQGTWELKFAQFLNKNNINWERSKTKHLRYKLFEEDYIHYYYPDFFLPDYRIYIEIKGFWWKSSDNRVDDKRKMSKVIEYNKDKCIIIIQKKEMLELGINL